jgi:hypothetical protein
LIGLVNGKAIGKTPDTDTGLKPVRVMNPTRRRLIMTRSRKIRSVGWTAALLVVCVLSLNAQAGPKQRGNNKKSGQPSRQVEKKDRGSQRQRAEKPRQARDEKKAESRREAQRDKNRDRAKRNPNRDKSKRDANRDRAKRNPNQEKAKRNPNRDKTKHDAGRGKSLRDPNRKAQADRKTKAEREAQQQAKAKREAKRQKAQREERRRQEREAGAHASRRVTPTRDPNWGVNAQRKKLNERQAVARKQEQQIKKKRLELQQRDNRLDNRAEALRRTSHRRSTVRHGDRTRHHKPVVIRERVVVHKPVHRPVYRPVYKPTRPYGHGVLRRHDDDNRYGSYGVYFRFGNASYFHYEHGHRRHYCCTGGYYFWRWVPAMEVTRYDAYGDPYTVVIRAGYYKRVWAPHYCRYHRHTYYRY